MRRSDSSPLIPRPFFLWARHFRLSAWFVPKGCPLRFLAAKRSGPCRRAHTLISKEAERPPRFPDNSCAHAPLYDPGRISRPNHAAARCSLPRTKWRRLLQKRLSRLNHAACTLPVYTLRRRSPDAAQHSVPAGGQPWPGGTLTRGVAIEISGSTSFPPLQAWPGVLGASTSR